MIKSRVLLVEDEADIRRFVRMALEQEGLDTCEASTAREARLYAASSKPDLVIVDLGLPDDDGKTFIRELRDWSAVPVIVLSARQQEVEKVAALDAGADDYLAKPFGVPELLARARAQLRRAASVSSDGQSSSVVRFGEVVVDLGRHAVTRGGEPVHLTRLEFRLLAALIRGQGGVIAARQLLAEVWGVHDAERVHYVRVYMTNLRQKLEAAPTRPRHLLTELQFGYRLVGLEAVAGRGCCVVGE
ncbi:response regulator [Burkholderia sp. FERM BP-3421]|uniref:response regulator n=1 Tax=Burkholderia sp. FERM BP-3421 TaxID=1494466 RepID=UPI0023619CB3|nr:response regulator [Burkholderia sp. FERM BP-3421]WDD90970.1 response regulator [Burkholderia sp. FERM BP-3421]